MTSEKELTMQIVEKFKTNIFENHVEAAFHTHSKLKEYKINPITVKYLSVVLAGKYNPEGVAKALYYPRVLGTSISTIFGNQIQKLFVELKMASPSGIAGIDIEFKDQVDKKLKWCQLKAGPNTINSEDVAPMMRKFSLAINRLKVNSAKGFSNNDFVVGVLYGEPSELSKHYQVINETYSVIIGTEFWYRITGYKDFYNQLVSALHDMTINVDTKDLLAKGCKLLEDEVRASPLFKF